MSKTTYHHVRSVSTNLERFMNLYGTLDPLTELEIAVELIKEIGKDSERLDWLDQNGGQIKHYTGTWCWKLDPNPHGASTGLTLREAIDQAKENS